MITYHQLRTFLAVSRTGSLTRAARELNMTQPTVSLQLNALRDFLGTPLFQGSLADPLAVGATFVVSRYVLPSALSRFREQFPDVDLQLHVEFPEPLFRDLLSNALDAGCHIGARTPRVAVTRNTAHFIRFSSVRREHQVYPFLHSCEAANP